MSMQRTLAGIVVGVAAGAALLAVAGTASAIPSAKSKLIVVVKPDPKVLKVDPDTGDPVKHDAYVLFALKGATPKASYRIITEQAPARTAAAPCIGGLNTQAYTASANGRVTFPLEPVGSGKYFPFAGSEPCKGNYVMNVEEQKHGSWITVRSFAFSYPSFRFSYLPLRP